MRASHSICRLGAFDSLFERGRRGNLLATGDENMR